MRSAVVDLDSQPIRNFSNVPRANAWSNSLPMAPFNGRWSQYSTYSLISGAADGPPATDLSTYARLTTTNTGGSRGGLGFDLAANPETPGSYVIPQSIKALPGEVHRISLWVRISVSGNINLRLRTGQSTVPGGAFGSGDTGTTNPCQAGVWVRVANQITIPAGDDRLAVYAVMTASVGDGVILDITGLMHMVNQPMPVDYCDGNTPGWSWSGTVGQSQSVGYPHPPNARVVNNIFTNPRVITSTGYTASRWFGGAPAAGSYSLVQNAGDGPVPSIKNYWRKTWTASPPDGFVGDTGVELSASIVKTPCPPGSSLTLGWWMRTNSVTQPRYPELDLYIYGPDGVAPATGGARHAARASSTPLSPNVWKWCLASYTVPAGRTDVGYIIPMPDIEAFSSATSWAPGDTLDICGAMLVRGTYPKLTYADGTYPDWRWSGSADASQATGYVYNAI